MKKKSLYSRRHPGGNAIDASGQDSFLDIVSNVVGILIILVMVAGARVGSVSFTPDKKNHAAQIKDSALIESPNKIKKSPIITKHILTKEPVDQKENANNGRETMSNEEKKEFVALCQKFEKNRDEIVGLHQAAAEVNQQLEMTKSHAEGIESEHTRLIEGLSKYKAAVELESEKKAANEKLLFDIQRQDAAVDARLKETRRIRDGLKNAPKKTVTLENQTTPFGKTVEGHEAFFVIRKGKISHIPMNVFTERLRSFFRNYRDINNSIVHEKIGPFEGYSFAVQAGLHQVREGNQTMVFFNFEYGECIPESEDLGETFEDAMKDGSVFRQKLALYLPERSTITLWVYPDSYQQLRQLKKHLLDHEYNIALRPMEAGRTIRFSPEGSKSMTY